MEYQSILTKSISSKLIMKTTNSQIMKKFIRTIFSVFIVLLCFNNPLIAQGNQDCGNLINPPITDEMFSIPDDPCNPDSRGDVIYTYEDFQASSDGVTTVLDVPIDTTTVDTFSQTSSDNLVDILSGTYGDQSIADLMECFDVLCSPHLDSAQVNLETMADAFDNANSISNSEIIDEINDVNAEEGTNVDIGEVTDSLGDLTTFADSIAQALNDLDLQSLIANELGISNIDCDDPSIWDDLVLDDNPFTGQNQGGVGESMINEMENKMSSILEELFVNNPELGGDPNWFLGEIEGLGQGASGSMMPSPSATSTINNIQSGVNLYNGSSSFGLPLDNISSKDVSVPISVNGTPGGLKVDDQEGLLGSNMDISAGGKITRVVNGLPDEFYGDQEGYAYGYKRGLKFVSEFNGIDVGLDLKKNTPKWLKKILCRVLKIILDAILVTDLTGGCSSNDINSVANGCLSILQGDPVTGQEATDNLPSSLDTLVNKILRERNLFDKGLGQHVRIRMYWAPPQYNYVNTQLIIAFPISPKVDLVIKINFRAGVKVVDTPSPVLVSKKGVGYNTLGDATKMADLGLPTLDVNDFDNLSDEEMLEFFNKKNSTKKRTDFEFFNPKAFSFLDAMENIADVFNLGNNDPYPVYNTEQLDLEPDEYYYDFGGYSGKFFIRPNGAITLVPYQDFEIIIDDKRGDIEGFVFITPEGVRYSFDKKAISRYDNYTLPSSFKYPEVGSNWDTFEKPVLGKVEYPTYKFLMGIPLSMEVKKDYMTNYYVEKGQDYTSAWHVTNIKSEITLEEIDIGYQDVDIHYNASKNWSHTFPNFETTEDASAPFETTPNTHLGLHVSPKEWKNGFADITYSMSEVFVTEPLIDSIWNSRGKTAKFYYGAFNQSIPGGKLCTKVEIKKNNNFYKAWDFIYEIPAYTQVSFDCNDPSNNTEEGQGPVYASDAEFKLDFDLPSKDDNEQFKYKFPIILSLLNTCIKIIIPIDLKFDINDNAPNGYYYMNSVSEYGSLMQIKSLLDLDDGEEDIRFQAEFVRNFLKKVNEVNSGTSIAEISYKGDLSSLPKRFSIHQDLWGNYNGISTSMSPFIKQSYGNENGVGNIGYNTDHFAFKHPSTPDSLFDQGRRWEANIDFAKIGQIDSILLETGAFLNYGYDLHQYPEDPNSFFTEGGIRISSLTKGSGNGPTKVTQYVYYNPTVINFPAFSNQHSLNRYYKDLEVKVNTSWKPLNNWQMNKSAYVGYAKVDEVFEGNGKIEHYFTNPELDGYEPTLPTIKNLHVKYKRLLRWEDNNYSNIGSEDLDYDSQFAPKIVKDWRLGLENASKVYHENGLLLQSGSTRYAFPSMQGSNGSMAYPKSTMFQYMHYGAYGELLSNASLYQLVDAGTSCQDNKIKQIIRFIIKNVFTEHPYRYVEKDFPYAEITVASEKVEPLVSRDTTFYVDGENYSSTFYTYHSNSERKINRVYQSFDTPQSGNSQSTSTEYEYADNFTDDPNYPFLDEGIMEEMDLVNYELPIRQVSKINGNVVSGSITDYYKEGGRYLTETVWGYREGELVLSGKFNAYNGEGMPTDYQLAKHATGHDPNFYTFFPNITMTWDTESLLLKTRSFAGFTTTNEYNDLCQVDTTTDANGLVSSYTYDGRRRLYEVVGPEGKVTVTYDYNMNPLTTATTSTFTDGTPPQTLTESRGGWGSFLSLSRQDGATLSSTSYDNLFRPTATSQLGSGTTEVTYEASPLSRVIESKDAVGNITEILTLGPNDTLPEFKPYTGARIKDPNGHISYSWQDAFGKPVISISGEGGITKTRYDGRGRVQRIINPIGEEYSYGYNTLGLLSSKSIPNKAAESYFYDRSMRMVVKNGGEGTFILDYDNAYRLTRMGLSSGGNYGDPATAVLEENAVNGDIVSDVLINTYAGGKTWIEQTMEGIVVGLDVDGSKTTVFSRDGIGRVDGTNATYSTSGYSVIESLGLNDAGIPTTRTSTINGPGNQEVLTYDYGLDDVLRQTTTTLLYDSESTLIESLSYNNQDQVSLKEIGGTDNGFLQSISYGYDGAGKLLVINSPTETACLNETDVCQLYWGNVESNIDLEDQNCGNLAGIILDGTIYHADPIIELTDVGAIEFFINDQIGQHGAIGSAEVLYKDYYGTNQDFHVSIMQTDVLTAGLIFENGCQYNLSQRECCTIITVAEDGNIPLPDAPEKVDLFFERITYDGLDISNIDMMGSCSAGLIKNRYRYDADHRVTQVDNTLFTPQMIEGAFSSSYTYDPAGNIKTLKRNGWVEHYEDFRAIDDLTYGYFKNGDGVDISKLKTVTDELAQDHPIAQRQGFGRANSESSYTYDGNGNMDFDSGKDLTIGYNLLNLPSSVDHPTDGGMTIKYTFGGEKIEKDAPDGLREYVGGAIYQGGGLEFIGIPNGRILDKAGIKKYQYNISDHLGNVVVVFEDVNDDGIISVEEDPDNPDTEIIQRNHYYSFGLRVDAPHFKSDIAPENSYLYNGKENNEELGLNWLSFGFREYDPAIGRFPSVDPIADQFAHVSGFNYAENDPVGHVDLWGLQKAKFKNGTESNTGPISQQKLNDFNNDIDKKTAELGGPNVTIPSLQQNEGNVSSRERKNQTGIGLIANAEADPNFFDRISNKSSNEVVGLDFLAANAARGVSTHVRGRGFAGWNSNVFGSSPSPFQISRLKFRTPLGTIRGNNVVRLSNGLRYIGNGAAGFGYLQIGNNYINGNIGLTQASIDATVNTYSWRGGIYGAAFGVGYSILGPTVTGTETYQNWNRNTWLPFRLKTFGY